MNSVEVVPTIEQLMKGTYQCISGQRWWASNKIAYSRNGSLWRRKVGNYLDYSFTFGQEVTFPLEIFEYKTTATIENNKLIHRTKEYLSGEFRRDIIQVEEFSWDKMLSTDTWDGKSYSAVYKKALYFS